MEWKKLSWKSAILFFLFIAVINLTLNPLLMAMGLSRNLSAMLVNAIGISSLLSFALLYMNNIYKNKRQASLWIAGIFVVTTALLYFFIYIEV